MCFELTSCVVVVFWYFCVVFAGWLGVGGSVLQWYTNDEHAYRIGFGFCGTGLHLIPTNERALKLQNEVQTCCEAMWKRKRRRLRTSKL